MEIIAKKYTVKWLHIVLSHKTVELKRVAEEISVLNHQIENFDKMNNDCYITQTMCERDIMNQDIEKSLFKIFL